MSQSTTAERPGSQTPASHRTETVLLTQELIRRRSVTPDDCGCQEVMIERLSAVGFKIERLRFGDVIISGRFMANQVQLCVLPDIPM